MIRSRLWIGACVLAATGAHAQSPASLITTNTAAKLPYESVFIDYRPYAEVEVAPWAQTNKDAAMSGGHMGHAGGTPASSTPAAVAPAATLPPRAPGTGHASHPRRPQ
jgi:hypothetical protein